MGRLNDRHQQFSLVRRANRAQGKTLTRSQAARLWASWRACAAFLRAPQNPAHARNLRQCNVRPWPMLPHWWNTSIRLRRARNFYSTAGGWAITPLSPHARGNLCLRPVVAAHKAGMAWGYSIGDWCIRTPQKMWAYSIPTPERSSPAP